MLITIPEPIHEALQDGAALAISISGGKDSQAMLYAVVQEWQRQQWTGEVFAIHAHLGRMEEVSGFSFRQDLRLGGLELIPLEASEEPEVEQLCLW